jgi:hypothetical protein
VAQKAADDYCTLTPACAAVRDFAVTLAVCADFQRITIAPIDFVDWTFPGTLAKVWSAHLAGVVAFKGAVSHRRKRGAQEIGLRIERKRELGETRWRQQHRYQNEMMRGNLH